MKRLKIVIELTPGLDKEFVLDTYTDEITGGNVTPTNDYILNEFSAHYHISTKRSLPPSARVKSVEDVTNAVG